jgi:hypothetical protein
MVKRFPLVIAWFAVIAFDRAMAKGGTNMHEMASSRHEDEKPNFMNSIGFIGCGRGRYRDSRNAHTDAPVLLSFGILRNERSACCRVEA